MFMELIVQDYIPIFIWSVRKENMSATKGCITAARKQKNTNATKNHREQFPYDFEQQYPGLYQMVQLSNGPATLTTLRTLEEMRNKVKTQIKELKNETCHEDDILIENRAWIKLFAMAYYGYGHF